MASLYNGIPSTITMPTAKDIASSTNASPIEITTSTPHGVITGDYVRIADHLVNTAANGSWEALVTSATKLKLVGSTGNGVGVATGTCHDEGLGQQYPIPADGDDPTGALFGVPYEALGDRTALLHHFIGWARTLYAGGVSRIKDGATVISETGTIWNLLGEYFFNAGSEVNLSGNVDYTPSSVTDLQDGATFRIHTQVDVKTGGSIFWESGGLLRALGGSLVDFLGTVTHIGATIVSDAATTHADASTITRTGPTFLNGTDAYTAWRVVRFDGAGGRPDGNTNLTTNAWEWDEIYAAADNKTWKLSSPPGGKHTRVRLVRFLSGAVDVWNIKDEDSNTIIYTFPAATVPSSPAEYQWADFIYKNGNGFGATWALSAHGGPT